MATTMINDFSGVWRSHYRYPSSGRGGEFDGEHYVQIHRRGHFLIIESLPDVNKSYLLIKLTVDGNIATGTWEEETDPNGYYKGAVYNGAIQLVTDGEHKRLSGKWLGHNKESTIEAGPWEIEYSGAAVPEPVAA